jgi:hypothetical protein
MNADLTFNSIVFKKSFDDSQGSSRQDVTRGVNTPDVMLIKSQDYVDSATKVAGKRFTIRFDRYEVDSLNRKIAGSLYAVIAVPETLSGAGLTALVATFKAGIADANLVTNVLNNER